MKIIYVISFIFIFLLTSLVSYAEINFNQVDDGNVFLSVPTTIKTFENDTVSLPCQQLTPARFVRWHRDDVLLVDSRHPENKISDRIHLAENGSLQVMNVQSEDTGDYYCEVMTSTGHAVQVHAIEVQYSPTVISNPKGNVEMPIGAIFEITCEALGIPHPVITWQHNDITIDEYHMTNRQTHIVSVSSRNDSGPIECVATNGVGKPAVAGINLIVLFAPEVLAVHDIVYAKNNMKIHLECIVESAPGSTVQWLLYGVPVSISGRISRHDTELQTNRSVIHYYTRTKHILIIKNIKDSDMGLYECRAENKIGFNSTTIELTGRPMPCIFKINPAMQTSTSHSLVWQTESLSSILEFKLQFRQIPSGNLTNQKNHNKIEWNVLTIPAEISIGPIYTATYTLHGLQPANVFEVMVLARNHFGWSEKSKILRFATGGEVELPNYSTESELQNEGLDSEEKLFNFTPQGSQSLFTIGASWSVNERQYFTITQCAIFFYALRWLL